AGRGRAGWWELRAWPAAPGAGLRGRPDRVRGPRAPGVPRAGASPRGRRGGSMTEDRSPPDDRGGRKAEGDAGSPDPPRSPDGDRAGVHAFLELDRLVHE